VILTEKDHRSPIKIFVEGKEKFEAYPGMLKGHKAVRIGRLIPRTQDLIEAELKSEPPAGGSSGNRGAA
jgi:flagellar motor switch protein FliM